MRFLCLWLLVVTASPAFAANVPLHSTPRPNITVLVDENIMLPATLLARAYAKTSSTPLTLVVKNAAEAEDQIEQGLEAHVVLTAHHDLVTRLANQGLTDMSSTHSVARTQLALVASRSLDQQEGIANRISFAAMLYATPSIPVYVEAPESEAGTRAQALTHGFEFSAQLTPRLQDKTTREGVLTALTASPALGLMLVTDALARPDIVLLNVLPEKISPPVRYEAVVLASESMDEARQFTRFLDTPQAQTILAHFGFQPAR